MSNIPSQLGVEVYPLNPVFSDERGDIFDIVEEPVGHTGMVTCVAGSVRGNHYHRASIQYNFVLEGNLELIVSNKEKTITEEYILKPGCFVRIPVGVVHTYKALTNAKMLDLTTVSRIGDGYEQDTVRVV